MARTLGGRRGLPKYWANLKEASAWWNVREIETKGGESRGAECRDSARHIWCIPEALEPRLHPPRSRDLGFRGAKVQARVQRSLDSHSRKLWTFGR